MAKPEMTNVTKREMWKMVHSLKLTILASDGTQTGDEATFYNIYVEPLIRFYKRDGVGHLSLRLELCGTDCFYFVAFFSNHGCP